MPDPTYPISKNPRTEYIENVIVPNEMLPVDPWPTKIVDASKIEERAFMEVELTDQAYAGMVKLVMEGVTDESWEKFQSDLDTLGYGEWIQWWQDYMDGNL